LVDHNEIHRQDVSLESVPGKSLSMIFSRKRPLKTPKKEPLSSKVREQIRLFVKGGKYKRAGILSNNLSAGLPTGLYPDSIA
jgi:hypothetical protein